jgi:hypothetical protein
MKKTKLLIQSVLLVLVLYSLTFKPLVAQVKTDLKADSAAILETALNYMEGAYTADADRMQKALWPELNKIIPRILPQTGKTILSSNCYSQLIEVVRQMKGMVDNSDKKIKVTIETINEGMACVKITSSMFNDFLQMAKIDGMWKIINVLWTWGADSPRRDKSIVFDPEKEKAGIEGAAMDYIDGFFSGDAVRMERAIHPEINKVTVVTSAVTGKSYFSKMGSGPLIEYTDAKFGLRDKEKREITVRIMDSMDNLASVEVISATLIDYLQLAKINESWKIINVLWKPKPVATK